MINWFVLWTLTGKEKEVLFRVSEVPGIDRAMVPTDVLHYRKAGAWEPRESVLIPGYVFVRCAMSSTIYHRIRGIPHVIGWLGSDSMWPTIVPEEEMIPVIAINAGCDPASYLKEVSIDRRKRRGRGSLTLLGQQQTLPFHPHTDATDKQPENGQVDQRPADDEGDQEPQELPQG